MGMLIKFRKRKAAEEMVKKLFAQIPGDYRVVRDGNLYSITWFGPDPVTGVPVKCKIFGIPGTNPLRTYFERIYRRGA